MLDFGKFLTEIRAESQKQPIFARLALLLEQTQDAVNQQGQMIGVDSSGHSQPPNAPASIQVKAANGLAHVTITDHSQRSRNLHYFVEADTNPSFPAPHVEHLGVSRGRFINLPAKDDNGDPQKWYFRAYSMYPGSESASAHQVLGGMATPTAVDVGGSVQMTPLSSTGSGTASTTGQQAGTGYGFAQFSKQK